MDENTPHETPGREDYYNAAVICIVLNCDSCKATLDPDEDSGPGIDFYSDGYFVLLGDEAFCRGWKITPNDERPGGYAMLCPKCAGGSQRT